MVVINTSDGPLVTIARRPSGALAFANCLSRAEWGADESLRFVDGVEDWPATFEPVRVMTAHHTATANDDSDPAATVRAIYYYHTVTNGWGDIAYHELIDESGPVYEGRWSGEASVPCGAGGDGSDFGYSEEGEGAGELVTAGHTYCYNRGNLGVALLGSFTRVEPKVAARSTLETLLAENASRNGLDPLGTVFYEAPNDMAACVDTVDADIEAIAAHTDWPDPAGATSCPGRRFYPLLPTVRENVALLVDPLPPPTTTTTVPPPGDITISVDTRIVRAVRYADLTWNGATSTQVDIWRDGAKISTTVNDGAYTDNTGSKKISSATYQVCEEGTTADCSEPVTVDW